MPIAQSYVARPVISDLPGDFWDPVEAAAFPQRQLRYRNQAWAQRVGLAPLTDVEWSEHFAGFAPLPDNLPRPLALRYHGYQFRQYNPALGDGRGFLFAQLVDEIDGRLLDLGTKGSGPTPYSRGGDGKLTLKGGVREVLATAMLEALGVYTSKTFSLFETGESLTRNDEPSPTRASVLVRLSHSHIRFGSFERHAHHRRADSVQQLVDYCLHHYFESCDDAVAMFAEVVRRSAGLAASWMIAGFVHGVLNTDNMNITGESFDYGPYRFLPSYQPELTAAYFDHNGLYAFRRQPQAVAWNLARLTDALALVAPREQLDDVLSTYDQRLHDATLTKFLERLGVEAKGESRDAGLLNDAYAGLAATQVDYGDFFFHWFGGSASEDRAFASPAGERYRHPAFEAFVAAVADYRPAPGVEERLGDDYFCRSHGCGLVIDEIEGIWQAICEEDDWTRFEAKLKDIEAARRAYGYATGVEPSHRER